MKTIYKKGFTLIELLIAIAIIGILSGFLLANFVGVRQRARDGVRKSDLRQIQSALEMYRSDQVSYPSNITLSCGDSLTSEGIVNNATSGTIYMKKIPCDPSTSTSYQYYSPIGTTYCLRTCFENEKDGDRDEIKNPSIVGCDLQNCTNGKDYTLQNP
jgi:general secretion pathway protein G